MALACAELSYSTVRVVTVPAARRSGDRTDSRRKAVLNTLWPTSTTKSHCQYEWRITQVTTTALPDALLTRVTTSLNTPPAVLFAACLS